MKESGCNDKVICIKRNNCDRTVIYHLESEEEFDSVITPFFINLVFHYVVLLWIIDKNKHYKFEIDLEDTKLTEKGTGIILI